MIDNSELTFSDWKKINDLFGLRLIEDTPNLPDEAYNLIREREAAREAKDYAKSDELRDLLLKQGIIVKDTSNGTVWSYL